MINPCHLTDRKLKTGFKINLESHNIRHAKSILSNEHNFLEFGIQFRNINQILKKMATFYDRLLNQIKFSYRTFSSASFYKINEEDEKSDEFEFVF